MGVRAVIFDVDGVLLDTEKIHVRAWEILFGKRGVTLSSETYRTGIGVSDALFLERLRGEGRVPVSLDAGTLLAEKQELLLHLTRTSVKVFPGVRETLESLSREYVLGAASNSPGEVLAQALAGTGLAGFFACVCAREDVERPKPAPDTFLLCAHNLGVSPERCVAVEDSAVGISAAQAAGMRCIAVTQTLDAGKLNEADIVLDAVSAEPIRRFIAG